MKRRAFIAKTSVGTLALAGAPLLWGQEKKFQGANERVRVAVIGIHGMGQNHIAAYLKLPNVEVAALCDVDQNLFPEVIQKHFKGKTPPKTYTDLRRLYADKSIDA
ncbi:MAG TPA: Gfo/Idh/MocA family oxidoreductase, partial [Candidatus Sulfotelmatobacter sp.]|nr:Gfo/Idh/MocA family oxidoreductase [Candidatus Sulfotelmatobacter sp.]